MANVVDFQAVDNLKVMVLSPEKLGCNKFMLL